MCATGFVNLCVGCIFILSKTNLQETFQNLKGAPYPKTRHLSWVSSGWGRVGVGGLHLCSPSGPRRAGFLIKFMDSSAWKEGAGDATVRNQEGVLRQPEDGVGKLRCWVTGSHRLNHVVAASNREE